MVKLQPHSGHFSPVETTIYELFRSKLYDGVWFAEKSQPDIFNISENLKTLLGYKPTDSVAWKDLISPQDLPSFTEQIQNISNAEHTSCTDIRLIHKNGTVLWTQTYIYYKLSPGQNKQYIFIAFKDISDQKYNELKVARQQQRDNDILNDSGIGTWEYNLITEEVVFNECCAKIIGYTLEELNEKENSFWDNLTHPDDLKRTRHLIHEHMTQKSSGFKNEVRVKHKDGHWVWVMDTGKVLSYTEDGQPEWLGGIHYTITERKNGDLLVQRYKDLLNDVNEAASIGIWEVNLKTNEVNCSEEIKKIFGVSFSHASHLDDLLSFIKAGKSFEKINAAVKNAIEKGENYDIEIEIVTADKKTIWCRAIGISEFNNGECTRFYGFFQNINDKIIATKELALQEELFRKTFSHAAVGMAVIDLKGNISKVNKSLCDYLGYSNQQLLENNFEQFSHPLDILLSKEFIEELLLGKRESFQLDKRYIHKDGSILWGHISVSSVRNEMGRITYFIVQVQDITERKKNELLLINYKDLLERSNAVAKIGSWEIDVHSHKVSWSSSLNTILNTRKDFTPTFYDSINYFIAEEHRKDAILTVKNALEKGMSFDIQILANANGSDSDPKWVRMIGISEFENGQCIRLYGLIQDIDDIKKAQCEIIIKEEQWRTTFNHANAGMALINFNGEAYMVNPSLSTMFGYTIKEMQAMRIMDISLEEDLEKNIQLMSNLIDGTIENFSQEMRFRHKNGDVIWANVSVSCVKNDFNQFTHMVAQLVDITDSKTNEILLKKYKELLERSNKVAKIGSWELNPENHMLYWSENLKRLLGNKDYKAHDFSDSIIDYVLEENQEKMAYLLNNALQNGHSFDFELQLKTASGLRWMRMIGISNFKNGICKSVHGLVQDIEEFKSAELEILLREEEFRQTFWHAPIGMVLLDLKGKIVRVNPGMCETLGYSETEILAINKSELSHPDDLEETNKLIQQLLSGELESFQQEKRYLHKNGDLIWTILSMSSVKNDKGQTTHFVCQVSNITREKLLTESLTEHNNRLQNYAHIVSHNLRSHTGNLSMLLELSEMNNKPGFEDEVFEHIKTASNNMCETVNHLSEIVEIQNLIKNTLVPINLRRRVKKILQNLRTAVVQINGEVVLKVKKELVVYGISSYVDSVILNILTNAIKYRSPHRLLVINIHAKKINGFTVLKISDNGLGIDLEQHGSKIFGMYKTFHDHKNARGIGLFISKNQIEAMGGSIEVESQPNIGSTFTIYFKDEDN